MKNTPTTTCEWINTEGSVSWLIDMQKPYQLILERSSTEYRKTKTKVFSPANHKEHKQYSEPIKIRSNYT